MDILFIKLPLSLIIACSVFYLLRPEQLHRPKDYGMTYFAYVAFAAALISIYIFFGSWRQHDAMEGLIAGTVGFLGTLVVLGCPAFGIGYLIGTGKSNKKIDGNVKEIQTDKGSVWVYEGPDFYPRSKNKDSDKASEAQGRPNLKERLSDLKELFDLGLIETEEYQAKKKELLEKI